MRFASVTHEGHALAVGIDGDVATPLLNISELGRGTPASLQRATAVRQGVLSGQPAEVPPGGAQPGQGHLYRAQLPRPHPGDAEQGARIPGPVHQVRHQPDRTLRRIPRPPESTAMDYEGELAVVIGEHIRRVSRDDALAAVAGYTVANDITMRDYQYKSPQWLQGKAWEAATPLGPWLVTPDEVGDVGSLSLQTTVNGQVVQEASTEQMIFDIATLISTISEFTSLDPGDLILTGTPSGVGFRREPKLLLGDDDVVVVEIEKVGRLENRIVDE